MRPSQHQTGLHHRLPSSGKWYGGAFPQAAQRFSLIQTGGSRLAVTPTWVLLGLWAAAKEDSGVSSAELLYGLPHRLPPDPASRLEASMEDVTAARATLPDHLPTRPLSYAEVLQDVPPHLAGAEMVFIRVGRTGRLFLLCLRACTWWKNGGPSPSPSR